MASLDTSASASSHARRSPLAELPVANFPPRPASPIKMHSSPTKMGLSASSSNNSILSSHSSSRRSSRSPSPSPAAKERRRMIPSASMPSPTRASSFMLAGQASSVASRGKLLFSACKGDETVGPDTTCDPDSTLLQQKSPKNTACNKESNSRRSSAKYSSCRSSPNATLSLNNQDLEQVSQFTDAVEEEDEMPLAGIASPRRESAAPKSLGRKKERVRLGEVAQAMLDQDEDMGHVRAGSPSPAMMSKARKDALQGSVATTSASPLAMLEATSASIGLGITSIAETSPREMASKSVPWTVLADEPIADLQEHACARGSRVDEIEAAKRQSSPAISSALHQDASDEKAAPPHRHPANVSTSLLTTTLSSLALFEDDKENRRPDRVLLQARKKKGTGGRLSLVADAAGEEASAGA